MPYLSGPPDGSVTPAPTGTSPDLLSRYGEGVANIFPEVGRAGQNLLESLGFSEPTEEAPKPFADWYEHAPAKNWKESGVDILSGLTKAVPLIAAGETAGAGIAELAGLEEGSTAFKAAKLAGGFAAPGAVQSPEQAAIGAATGGTMAVIEHLPPVARYPLSALFGLASYAEAKREDQSETAALTQGAINAFLPNLSAHLETRAARLKAGRVGSGESLLEEQHQDIVNPPDPDRAGTIIQPQATGPTLDEALAKFAKADEEELAALQQPRPPAVRTERATPAVVPVDALPAVPAPISAVPAAAVPAATVDTSINPSRQLKLKTVLHADDSQMVQKAATKLGLEYKGTMGAGDQQFLEFKIPEDAGIPAAGANVSFPMGGTMKDLRDHIGWKKEQFTAANTEDLNAINKKWGRGEVGVPETKPAEPEVATLQPKAPEAKVAPPPSPLRTEPEPPQYREGELVYHDIGDGPEQAKVISTDEKGVAKVRMLSDKSEWDVHQDNLSLNRESDLPAVIDHQGGMEDLARLEEQNSVKGRGMKLRQRPEEYGGIDPELAVALGRYVAAPIVGSIVGAATADPDERLHRALLGALAGGLAGHFGPRALKFLAETHPEVGKAGTVPEKIKAILNAGVDMAKALKMDKDLAAAAIQTGNATGAQQFARYIEQRWGRKLDVLRAVQKSWGPAQLFHGKNIQEALNYITKDASFSDPGVKKATLGYWTGEVSLASLRRSLNNNEALINNVVTARASADGLQDLIIKGMKADDPLAKEIAASKGKYLTTTYEFYSDKKYYPTDAQVAEAAKHVTDKFGTSEEIKINLVNQFLRDEKTNLWGYRSGMKRQGEAFGGLLSKMDPVPESWKEMLGPIDDPIKRMAATGVKLVTSARISRLYDLIDEGVSTEYKGIKYAYTGDQLQATISDIRAKLASGSRSTEEVATLQKQLGSLKAYMPLTNDAKYGVIAGKWIDHNFHDQLQTADSVMSSFKSPLMQHAANFTNMVKLGHTALSPFQVVRNIISMPSLGILSGTTPADWYKAGMPLMRILGNRATAEDIAWADRLKKNGVLYGDVISGQFYKDMKPMLNGTLDTLAAKSGLRGVAEKWFEFYAIPDLTTRVARFERSERQALEAGMSAAEAEAKGIDDANRYCLNYAGVPKAIQMYRQLPFINQYASYAYDITRISKNLLEDAIKNKDIGAAARLAAVAATPFILAKMSESLLSDKDKADWEKSKNLSPDYNRENFKVVWGRDPVTKNFKYTDVTPIVVQDNLIKTMKALLQGDWSAAWASNPVIGWENTPLLNLARNQMSGSDLHTGRKFSSASTGENLMDRFTSARKDIAPTLFGGADLDKIVEALKPNAEGGRGITNLQTGQKNSMSQFVWSYLTGTKNYSVNLNYQQQRYLQEVTGNMRDEIAQYSRVKNSDLNPSLKQAAAMRVQNRLIELRTQARTHLGLDSASNGQ